MDNRKIISVSFMIIALSIAYYFVIFLPQRDKERLELQKQEQQAKDTKTLSNKYILDACLQDADRARIDFWNKNCKNIGLKDDCELPSYRADTVTKAYSEQKDDCFKKYPQN